MKCNLLFLILFFALTNLYSCAEDENSHFNIAQVSGILYEKRNQQDVMIVFPRTNINPSSIKQVIIKNEEKMEIYPIKLNCDYKKEILFNTYVKCTIDLTNVPSGLYKIILLIYNNMHHTINNMLPFLVLEADSPDKPLQLLDIIYENVTESDYLIKLKLLFSKRIDQAHTVRFLDLNNFKNGTLRLPIVCDYGIDMSVLECEGNLFNTKGGKYLVKDIDYGKGYIYPSKDIYILIQPKDNLNLVDIKGNTNKGWSDLELKFNKRIDSDFISDFRLFNKTWSYDLFTPYINQSNWDTVAVEFDFTFIPVGIYHLGMLYNGIEYNYSKVELNITDDEYPHFWNLKNVIYNLVNSKKKSKS